MPPSWGWVTGKTPYEKAHTWRASIGKLEYQHIWIYILIEFEYSNMQIRFFKKFSNAQNKQQTIFHLAINDKM